MKRFKYRLKDNRELWVCEACKKSHAELILLKSWQLIDRKEDGTFPECEYCSQMTYPPQQTLPLTAAESIHGN